MSEDSNKERANDFYLEVDMSENNNQQYINRMNRVDTFQLEANMIKILNPEEIDKSINYKIRLFGKIDKPQF